MLVHPVKNCSRFHFAAKRGSPLFSTCSLQEGLTLKTGGNCAAVSKMRVWMNQRRLLHFMQQVTQNVTQNAINNCDPFKRSFCNQQKCGNCSWYQVPTIINHYLLVTLKQKWWVDTDTIYKCAKAGQLDCPLQQACSARAVVLAPKHARKARPCKGTTEFI